MTKIKNGVSTEYVDQIRKEMTKMGMSKDSQDRAIQAQWGLLGAAMRESQPIDKVAKMLYAIKNSSFKTGCMKAENAISAKLKNAGIKIGNENYKGYSISEQPDHRLIVSPERKKESKYLKQNGATIEWVKKSIDERVAKNID